MSVSPDKKIFCTGSVDRTIKLWDLRDPKHCIQTFWGHTSDVNSVYVRSLVGFAQIYILFHSVYEDLFFQF